MKMANLRYTPRELKDINDRKSAKLDMISNLLNGHDILKKKSKDGKNKKLLEEYENCIEFLSTGFLNEFGDMGDDL